MRKFGGLLVLAGLVAWGCGGSANPAGPGASPTPAAPKPTPAPAPSPTPTPVTTKSCTVPANHPDGVSCAFSAKAGNGYFYYQVYESIAKLRQQKPDFFDGIRVRQVNKYFDGVIRILEEDYGLCAVRGGPPDEIGVKDSNTFSEQYDILASDSYGNPITNWAYTVTCKPARF